MQDHITHFPTANIVSATAFTISGGLDGPMDVRPSAANPIRRAAELVSAMGGLSPSANQLSAQAPVNDASTVTGQNQIAAVRASSQDATTRQFAVGRTLDGDTDALELWLALRGQERLTTPL